MAQWQRALAAFQKVCVQFQAFRWWLTIACKLVPRGLIASSGLLGHQGHTWYIDMYIGKRSYTCNVLKNN